MSAYLLGSHTLVRCDPAVVDRCRARLGDHPVDLDGFEQALRPIADTMHGRGLIHVMEDVTSLRPEPRDTSVVPLDPGDAASRALIEGLVGLDPDGADEAEIDMDDLDTHIVGVVHEGALAAYASERPWDLDPAAADIGVLTAPDQRGRGLGHAVVVQLTRQIMHQGRIAMYRCDQANTGSKALCDRVGFTDVCALSAVTLAAD